MDYVESVAKFTYTLETMACLLHDYYLDAAHVQFNVLSKAEQKIIAQLLASVQGMCLAIDKDNNEVVPNLLIKCIVCKYGMSTLITLCDISNYIKLKEINFRLFIVDAGQSICETPLVKNRLGYVVYTYIED